MTTTLLHPTVAATANVPGALSERAAEVVIVTGGDVSLDATRAPYATATVEVPIADGTVVADLDPRADVRVVIAASNTGAWTGTPPTWTPDPARTFDLGMRSREVDHVARTVRLTLASDEALVIDYAALVKDTTPQTYQKSLRSIVNYVLGLAVPGKALEPGGPDADMTTYFSATNIIKNGGVRVDAAGWQYANAGPTGQAGRAAAAIPADPNISATAIVTGLSAGTAGAAVGLFYAGGVNSGNLQTSVSPGQHVYCRCWVQVNAAAVPLSLNFQFTAANVVGPTVTPAINTWTLLELDAVVPAGNTAVGPYVYSKGTSPGGLNVAVAGLSMWVGTKPDEFFDGAAVDTAGYLYDWTGTANLSTSTRTALIQRPPEMLIWGPGVTGWDFLAPLLTQAGMRLFCDELRKWRMVLPADYKVPGLVSATAQRTTRATDTTSREDAQVFATGVVVHYRWTDPATADVKDAYDQAGTPKKVLVVEYALPYPGPGAAKAILARRSGTGRTHDIEALAQWAATPGMEASITLPSTNKQQGKVAGVTFSLGDDALMRLATRGLIDIPRGAIDLLVGTIDAQVGTIDNLNPTTI